MVKIIKWIIIGIAAVGLYFLIAIYWTGYNPAEIKEAEAAVVFGAAQYNGEPSPIFEARLDHAKKLYEDSCSIILFENNLPLDENLGNNPSSFDILMNSGKFLFINGSPSRHIDKVLLTELTSFIFLIK